MFVAILVILILPFVDINKIKSSQFKPLNKFLIYVFVADFILLGALGGSHPTNIVSYVGLLSTVSYFFIIVVLMFLGSLIENTTSEIYKLFSANKSVKKELSRLPVKNLLSKNVRLFSTTSIRLFDSESDGDDTLYVVLLLAKDPTNLNLEDLSGCIKVAIRATDNLENDPDELESYDK